MSLSSPRFHKKSFCALPRAFGASLRSLSSGLAAKHEARSPALLYAHRAIPLLFC